MSNLIIPVEGSCVEQLGIENAIQEAQQLHQLLNVEEHHSVGIYADFSASREKVSPAKFHFCCSAVRTEWEFLERELVSHGYLKINEHSDKEGDLWRDFQKDNILLSLQQNRI